MRKISQSPRFPAGKDPERNTPPDHGANKPKATSSIAGAGAYAGMGLTFALSILLFVWVGQWVDDKLGTSPLFLILGTFIGAGAGFYSIYRRLTAQQKRDEAPRDS